MNQVQPLRARTHADGGSQDADSIADQPLRAFDRGNGTRDGGMTDRVTRASGRGGAGGMRAWVEAWGTAALIDRRIDAVTVSGTDFQVDARRREAALSAVETAVRGMVGPCRGGGHGPVFRIVEGDRSTGCVAVLRAAGPRGSHRAIRLILVGVTRGDRHDADGRPNASGSTPVRGRWEREGASPGTGGAGTVIAGGRGR